MASVQSQKKKKKIIKTFTFFFFQAAHDYAENIWYTTNSLPESLLKIMTVRLMRAQKKTLLQEALLMLNP